MLTYAITNVLRLKPTTKQMCQVETFLLTYMHIKQAGSSNYSDTICGQ